MISGNVARQIVDAIVDGYNYESLERALYFQMNLRVTDHVPASDTFPTQVLKIVQWADRVGRLSELIDAAQRENPTNKRLQALSGISIDEKAARPLRMLVTGGRDATDEVLRLAFLVGENVISHGHILWCNGSRGVDREVANGANAACLALRIEPSSVIQVIRPRNSPTPEFTFGKLEVVTADHEERRLYTVLRCDVVILIGGHRLSLELARWALIAGVPLVPLGKGTPENASVIMWHQVHNRSIDSFPIVPIGHDDLSRIGPEREDLGEIAKSAVEIAARLGQEYRSSFRK